ncbi:hypothetical protein LTR53_013424 [Teratosphaeriaceae sp. CCFEE 6253]|nr:hypothetical protein LTR53_013424 [Teratosphaeriaceae sp. CCFEE 6253]
MSHERSQDDTDRGQGPAKRYGHDSTEFGLLLRSHHAAIRSALERQRVATAGIDAATARLVQAGWTLAQIEVHLASLGAGNAAPKPTADGARRIPNPVAPSAARKATGGGDADQAAKATADKTAKAAAQAMGKVDLLQPSSIQWTELMDQAHDEAPTPAAGPSTRPKSSFGCLAFWVGGKCAHGSSCRFSHEWVRSIRKAAAFTKAVSDGKLPAHTLAKLDELKAEGKPRGGRSAAPKQQTVLASRPKSTEGDAVGEAQA